MNIRQTASVYFALQAAAVVAWWILLLFVPASRSFFQMGDSETILLAFWLSDLSLLAIGSLLVSVFCFFDGKFKVIALWFVMGAISYAAFYCLAFALLTDTGWLGVTLMLPAMLWSGVYAMALSPSVVKLMFRRSVSVQTKWIIAKTSAQIIIVWSIILLVFPTLIVQLEAKLGVPHFTFPLQKILAAILFGVISFPGLSGAYTMARIGRGTPLPLDAPQKLVVSGIYSFIRNPMAISGVGQGLAVGLFLGSPLVLIYALMGAFIWQFIFRPLEEEDLLINFGADYEDYCRNVRCWIPRKKPYQIETAALSSNSIESPLDKI
jgi:protein-S-isoprenylcysteine O-methyltransferase Ste14